MQKHFISTSKAFRFCWDVSLKATAGTSQSSLILREFKSKIDQISDYGILIKFDPYCYCIVAIKAFLWSKQPHLYSTTTAYVFAILTKATTHADFPARLWNIALNHVSLLYISGISPVHWFRPMFSNDFPARVENAQRINKTRWRTRKLQKV